MTNNTEQINFAGMHISEAVTFRKLFKPNRTLILVVEPVKTVDELLITSSEYHERKDGKFALQVIFTEDDILSSEWLEEKPAV